jgi:hypothetical protein
MTIIQKNNTKKVLMEIGYESGRQLEMPQDHVQWPNCTITELVYFSYFLRKGKFMYHLVFISISITNQPQHCIS